MPIAAVADALALPRVDVASEAQYHAAWQRHVQHRVLEGPFAMALVGGYLADRLAWVFVAGYQAALRATFADLPLSGWAALAVSEDRSEQDPLPGLTWQSRDGGYLLDGHKTWIAAVDHVQHIIVRARGDRPALFLVDRDNPGLTLVAGGAPSMLPDLSQGQAHLQGAGVDIGSRLESGLIADFSRIEALHIYIAFLGMCLRAAQTCAEDASRCVALLGQAEQLANDCDAQLFAAFSTEIQALRKHLGNAVFAQDAAWQRDQRLISMYHRA